MTLPTDTNTDDASAWDEVLTSLCHLQKLLPDAVAVGGTASALYAGHRLSFDHDHVLPDLRARFDSVLADLESVAGWQTMRVRRPVLIPGQISDKLIESFAELLDVDVTLDATEAHTSLENWCKARARGERLPLQPLPGLKT